jgi:hypothetical protein
MTLTAARAELKRTFAEIDKWTHTPLSERPWNWDDTLELGARATKLIVAIQTAFENAKAGR